MIQRTQAGLRQLGFLFLDVYMLLGVVSYYSLFACVVCALTFVFGQFMFVV